MLDFSRVRNYYIACGYTDMRKQIDGLAAVVELQFGRKLDETSIFLFCGRREYSAPERAPRPGELSSETGGVEQRFRCR